MAGHREMYGHISLVTAVLMYVRVMLVQRSTLYLYPHTLLFAA